MKPAMRGLIGLVGLFNIAIGLGFLLMPQKLGLAFFLAPTDIQGLATLRADFPGFFVGAATFALIGAWRADSRLLLVPMLMIGLALFGRCVSVAVDGTLPTTVPPMLVEAFMLVLLGLGYRAFRA